MSAEPEPGALIGRRYQLDALLGEGGMGSVWAATHTVTRRRYALKFLKTVAGHRDDLRRRFWREASLASRVKHPNVVGVHDLFQTEDSILVMVMDLLEGRTLGACLREVRQLSLSEAASYLVPAVSAVGAAHALGIVHRDLKPENIFLAGQSARRAATANETGSAGVPAVKVLDFGIAKLTQTGEITASRMTATGSLLGTPSYMAPEQAFGERDVDHRADIWSFGVILYEALAGARPVEGENLPQVLKRLMDDAITPIDAIVPDLPADVARLIARMLSPDRGDRPEDLREVVAVLERHTEIRAPSFGAPASRSDEVLDESPPLTPPVAGRAPRSTSNGKTKRRSSLWIGGMVLAVLGLSFAAQRLGRDAVDVREVRTTIASPARATSASAPAPRSPAGVEPARQDHAPGPLPLPAGSRSGAERGTLARTSPKRARAEAKMPEAANAPSKPQVSRRAVHAAEDGFVDDPPF